VHGGIGPGAKPALRVMLVSRLITLASGAR